MTREPQQEQLDGIVAVLSRVLGADVVAAYLYGSAVTGGLRPRSDLDVFVVSRQRTTREEKQVLIEGLLPLSRRGKRPPSWRPVEVTVVAQPDVRPWRYPPRMDFQYGEWLHKAFESGNVEPSPQSHSDLGVLITMVLLAGKPLLGPPAAEILDPVPHDDLVRAMVNGVEALFDDLERHRERRPHARPDLDQGAVAPSGRSAGSARASARHLPRRGERPMGGAGFACAPSRRVRRGPDRAPRTRSG